MGNVGMEPGEDMGVEGDEEKYPGDEEQNADGE